MLAYVLIASQKGFLGVHAKAGTFANRALSGTVAGLASAATRSAISGENFGDSLRLQLPSIIGQIAGAGLSSSKFVQEQASKGAGSHGGVLGFLESILQKPGKIANTIGNLVADGISGGGKPKADGTDAGKSGSSTAASDGTPSSGNSGGGTESLDGEIVVTAQRQRQWRDFNSYTVRENGVSAEWQQVGLWGDFKDQLRRQATEKAETAASASIAATLLDPRSSRWSKILLAEFATGGGPTLREFDQMDNPEIFNELFSGPSGEYFQSVQNSAVDYIVRKFDGNVPNDGVLLTKFSRDFSPLDGLYGLSDGVQIGDVIGTFTSGVYVTAVGGGVWMFEAGNKMTLSSFSGANVLNHDIIINPKVGQFSPKEQIFRWYIKAPSGGMR